MIGEEMQRLSACRVSVEVDAHKRNEGTQVNDSSKHRHSASYWLTSLPVRVRTCILAVLAVCLLTTVLNVYQLRHYQTQQERHRVDAEYSQHLAQMIRDAAKSADMVVITDEKSDRLLTQPLTVLKRLGYEKKAIAEASDWDVLWAYYYPFNEALDETLKYLQPYQKVNHFPGTRGITWKLSLATLDIKRVPPAFRLPADVPKLMNYAAKNPGAKFVQKNTNHRGIVVKTLDQLDLNNNSSFVQRFVDNPMLIDGYMFDVGVYVILTSVDPLRVYIYEGEAVVRFCTEKYHPFDATQPKKYVIGNKYLSPWEIKSLKDYYLGLGLSMRDSLDAYLKSIGKDPSKMWRQIEQVMRQVFYKTEAAVAKATKRYQESKRSFFEVFRADFMVDESLDVHLMEVNFSPNLSLGTLTVNKQRYEQLLYNAFSLVNVGRKVRSNSFESMDEDQLAMQVCDKNLAVFPATCASEECRGSCESLGCQLCKRCWSTETREMLVDAYLEHGNRLDCKRLVPPGLVEESRGENKAMEHRNSTADLSKSNQLMHRWFKGKCQLNPMWCS